MMLEQNKYEQNNAETLYPIPPTLDRIIRDSRVKLLKLETINPLSANPTKWSNKLKQFVGKSQRII